MSDHKCFRCPECGSCPACAADALDRVIEEAENLRERLDQFDAHGFPNVAAALDRVNAAESRAARAEAALREIHLMCAKGYYGADAHDYATEAKRVARAALVEKL